MSVKEDTIRIWRSPFSSFYDEEALHAAEKYTPAVLRGIARAGFNAIWIHAILREIVPSPVFPELGRDSAPRLNSLRELIRRAEAEGMKVFLYMQPPRGFSPDDPFWQKHPEARGVTWENPHYRGTAMCTSEPKVKAHLRGCAERLALELPGLGGVILITASEFMSHCYSHHNYRRRFAVDLPPSPPLDCPRCAKRHPSDVAAEIINLIHDGLRAGGSNAKVIAWNWSWSLYEPDPGNRIIRQLPKDVILLGDFERGERKKILGKMRLLDEYSLSFPGPSRRFLKLLRAARSRGHKVMAKLQIGTTHELATVPNLPLIGSLYEKAAAMRRLRIKGFMGCWNFGNMLTANTAGFIRFMDAKQLPPREVALRRFAENYFPGADAAKVAAAWEKFGQAIEWYPFSIPFLYYSPVNYAMIMPIEPGPLNEKPCGRSWMQDERGDRLEASFAPFTLEELIRGLGNLTAGWKEGVALLESALHNCASHVAEEELNTAKIIGHCFHSAWNLYRAYPLRRDWSPRNEGALRQIMADEHAHLIDALPIVARDKRMGFHSECQHYLFDADGIRRKLARLAELLRRGRGA